MLKYLVFIFFFLASACVHASDSGPSYKAGDLKLMSPAFKEGKKIPERYTCNGVKISPRMSWKDVPEGTMSFVLVMEDLDSYTDKKIYWLVYNIPRHKRSLEVNIPAMYKKGPFGYQGVNDFGFVGLNFLLLNKLSFT